MRPASQKKRFLLSYHADDMRSYRLLRFGAGVVYDPHSLDSVGRSCGRVIPFLPGDAVKIALAAVLSKYLVKASLSLVKAA